MNDTAGADLIARFRDSFNEQVHKTIARHIHTKVRDARSDPDTAAQRWPFELIQNAHDAGARAGRTGITLTFKFADGVLRFEHDATPFSMADVTALLTGGSSKDFTSTYTTGRFGTGFLVTHVLSESVEVTGVLEVDGQYQSFDVELDRPDDEDLILDNFKKSEAALGETSVVADFAHEPTAIFEYIVDDDDTALAGLEALEEALPHLFATCRRLRKITIQRDDEETEWKSDGGEIFTWHIHDPDDICETDIRVSRIASNGERADWRVARIASDSTSAGRLVVALNWGSDAWVVCKPGNVPSIFRQLPVLGGPNLGAWWIIDGEFDVEQERKSIHVIGEAGKPLREAFAALGGLMLLGSREGWVNGFRLGQLAAPIEVGGESATRVWREVLSSAAANVARLAIVNTDRAGRLSCVNDGDDSRCADFIKPTLSGPSYAELWKLAAACTEVYPPVLAESEGWSEIAEGWEALGVSIPWIDLKSIGERASSEIDDLSELRVDEEPYEWLPYYLDAVGKIWGLAGVTKTHVDNLLPDQHGKLRNAGDLRWDNDVSEELKAISTDVGLDIKAELLDRRLIEALSELGLDAGLNTLREATGDALTEHEAAGSLIEHLSNALPEDQQLTEECEAAAGASIALLKHLWSSQGVEARQIASGVPVLAADGTARRAGPRRLMVPPVSMWPEAARPFSEAYPLGRVLADRYAGQDPLLPALAAWDIAHSGLLVATEREELRDRGLKAIAGKPEEAEGAILRGANLMQVALLEPEIINYCKQSRERARALLGLVVCFVAPTDVSWRSEVEMTVRAKGVEKRIKLTPSLWLSDLRTKPWIPIEHEDDVTHHIASPELVRALLDPSWLQGNSGGADLLVRHFAIDALDVRLLAAASDKESRQALRDRLAKIVEVIGDDSEMMDELVIRAQQQKRDVDRMRRLGLAVQDSVKRCMEKRGLEVGVVDHGYDFLITDVEVRENDSEELSAHFEVNEYKVEVKTTSTNEARLTPLQAATCADDPESFVLCVVDLRHFEGDIHQVDWSTADVAEYCRLVSGDTLPIDETLSYVRGAEDTDVPIRNAAALRYAVGSDLWGDGADIDQWVESAFAAE